MRERSKGPLLVAAGFCFGIALLHAGIALAGPAAYTYFGAPELAPMEAAGSPVPDLVTSGLVVAFTLGGYYALAAAGRAPWRPPLLALGLVVLSVVFTLRGAALGPELIGLITGRGTAPPRYAIFSLVALVTGLAFALGTWRAWPALRAPRTPARAA